MSDRARTVTGYLQQVSTNSIKPMMAGQPSILVQRSQQPETFRRAPDHGRRDRMVEHHHGIVGHMFQEFIQRQDLRPVSVLSSGRLDMNSGNSSL